MNKQAEKDLKKLAKKQFGKMELPQEVLDSYKVFIECWLNTGMNSKVLGKVAISNTFTIDKDTYFVELSIKKLNRFAKQTGCPQD